MAKYFGLLVCLALIHTGYALQCYNCVSNPDSKLCDDFTDKDKISVATCGKTVSATYKAACIKKVIEDKSSHMLNTTRSCVIMKADGTTDSECKSTSDRYTVPTCEVCYDDLCNSSDHQRLSVLAFLGAAMVALFMKHLH